MSRPGSRGRGLEHIASRGASPTSSPRSGQSLSPNRSTGQLPADPVPVAQLRSHRLEPIALQPKTPREGRSPRGGGYGAPLPGPSWQDHAGQLRDSGHLRDAGPLRDAGQLRGRGGGGFAGAAGGGNSGPPYPSPYGGQNQPPPVAAQQRQRSASQGKRKNKFAPPVNVPPHVLVGCGHIAAGVRDMNWVRLFQAIDVIIRYLVPCEAVTLYLVEEGGRYLRRVNTYLDAFPPNRRGHSVEAVSENTVEGAAAMSGEPCRLPVKGKSITRAQADWASREALNLIPLPPTATLKDVKAGMSVGQWPPPDWQKEWQKNGQDSHEAAPHVTRIRNVLAYPLRFGTPGNDPFADYASEDSSAACADETIFGVLKLTNRLAPKGKKNKLSPVDLTSHPQDKNAMKYQPFSPRDFNMCHALCGFLKEVYTAVDPVTFGSRIEASLNLHDEDLEPLNGPSLISGRSIAQSQSVASGSRMLSHLQNSSTATAQGFTGGMFGILGNAFAKGNAYRRRAAELPDLVTRPKVQVTSDSTEAMRAAPGWLHKEWTDDDFDHIGADQASAAKRRIGGITILATWRLRNDVKIDPYSVICRFQIRVMRTSRVKPSQPILWTEMPPFFCVSPEDEAQQYCAFLTDLLHYGEEYIVSVRAGSAERWSEWSESSDSIALVARPLEPMDPRANMACAIVPPVEDNRLPLESFRVRDHLLQFSFPAFTSFDPRTPLPVEYCVEAWQRQDDIGAAAIEQLKALTRSQRGPANVGPQPPMPGGGPEWIGAKSCIVTTISSDAVQGQMVHCEIDMRRTALVPCSLAYFCVRGRYLSLPGEATWSTKALWSAGPTLLPELVPDLPSPIAVPAANFQVPAPDPASAAAALAGMGTMILKWPFRHPANFCPARGSSDSSGSSFQTGPFIPNQTPSEFLLPFRVQCRVMLCKGESDNDTSPPRWSEWREVESYEFVRQQFSIRGASQKLANRWASERSFANGQDPRLDENESECLHPRKDPLGVLTDEWALLVSGLDVAEEEPAWSGLTQLRWVSCGAEGSTSAASRTLCSRLAPASTPQVLQLVENVSSGSKGGKRSGCLEDVQPDENGEWVVHELRHVVRLTWQLDTHAASFGFLTGFVIRYQEVPPGQSSAKDGLWTELPGVPLSDARDETVLSEVTLGAQKATFSFDIKNVAFLRYYTYIFSVQMTCPENGSPWSSPSQPMQMMLPEVIPPVALGSDEASTEEGSGKEQEDDEQQSVPSPREHGEPEGEEEPRQSEDDRPSDRHDGKTDDQENLPAEEVVALPSEASPKKQQRKRNKQRHRDPSRPPRLLEAQILCADQEDSSLWAVELRWQRFPLAPGGAEAFPPLLALPVEFQVSFAVLSDRACAKAQNEAMTFGPSFVRGWATMGDDASLVAQREAATVCLEGSIHPSEEIVTRLLPRSRLPPLRCDVRLFLTCRCAPTTGQQWSRQALCVDLCLPRHAPLPLPVPQQISCLDLQRQSLAIDIGMPGPDEVAPIKDLDPDGLWAVLSIPRFPFEFVLDEQGNKVPASNLDLLNLEGGDQTAKQAHYVLQYRRHDPEAPSSSAGAKPLGEERDWAEVPLVRRLDTRRQEEGETSGRVFLAATLDPEVIGHPSPGAGQGHCWALFRVASDKLSHFSYASSAAAVSPLVPPARPDLAVIWVDSPSLNGACIHVSALGDKLSQSYQLRYRLSSADPKKHSSWVVCELATLDLSQAQQDGVLLQARAPVDRLDYHSEYCFSLRSCSLWRFSPWSEDSEPLRLSLEHFGMVPKNVDEGLSVKLLGQQERHNGRCSMADVTWPSLVYPPGVWGPESVSPSPELTIEYRLRWRRRITAFNEGAALFASMDELRGLRLPDDEWEGAREENEAELLRCGMAAVRTISPDPDQGLRDVGLRGYRGDCTKRAIGPPACTPWQIAAIVPAKVCGPTAVDRCACALPFLQPGSDYDVAVDWRWRRLGDSFWMPAYGEMRFHVPLNPICPPLLRPLRILPEVWDRHEQLRDLCGDVEGGGNSSFSAFSSGTGGNESRFALFEWPFRLPPASSVLQAPAGQALTEEARLDPGNHFNFVVQCRPRQLRRQGQQHCNPDEAAFRWATCQSRFLMISGKPACFVQPSADASSVVLSPAQALDEPQPPRVEANDTLDDDELEFRLLRTGDCEASKVLSYSVPMLAAPHNISCTLKMSGPHSTLGLVIRFHGSVTAGMASAPEEYQVRVEEVDESGSIVSDQLLLPSVRLPLERIAEAFEGVRNRLGFLGSPDTAPADRNELGSEFAAARSGGEDARQLEPLEFEHVLSLREISYGKRYRLAVRWLSSLKVSSWSLPAEATIWLPPPTFDGSQVLQVCRLEPLDLPADLAGFQDNQAFRAPALVHRAELTWTPFSVSLWSGGHMEYRLERRCLIHDRRVNSFGNVLPDKAATDIEATPWELIATVIAEINNNTGAGQRQLTNVPDSSEQQEQQSIATAQSAGKPPSSPRDISKKVLEMVYTNQPSTRTEVNTNVRNLVYSHVAGGTAGRTHADTNAGQETEFEMLARNLCLHHEELLPSCTYQFRVLARLQFHPASLRNGEWSEPLVSDWHRTDLAVHEPAAPREAVVPDDPPSPELFEDGSALLVFDNLPICEAGRPEGFPPPAPYVLQFRGAQAGEDADWVSLNSMPLNGDHNRILVSDACLKGYIAGGAVFRLWRCQPQPWCPHGKPHSVKDDARVRHFSNVASMPSKPIALCPPRFAQQPRTKLVYRESADLQKGDRLRSDDPPPALLLRLEWTVEVLPNPALDQVRFHQIRFRRVWPSPATEFVLEWQVLSVFEHATAADKPDVAHELPLLGPNFLFGADYEVSVRMASENHRWCDWCPPVPFSIQVRPPEPPQDAQLVAEPLTMQDGVTFFRLRWPAFVPDPLCNCVEYRVRMVRRTRYRYMERLPEDILARSEESLAAQEIQNVVGTLRRRVPNQLGELQRDVPGSSSGEQEMLEFEYRVVCDAECGYVFYVDAKHERHCEVDEEDKWNQKNQLKLVGEQEEWSRALDSRERVVPPTPRNWIVPEAVCLEAAPPTEPEKLQVTFPISLGQVSFDGLSLADASKQQIFLFAPWHTSKEAARWHRIEYAPYVPCVNPGRVPLPGDLTEDDIDWHLPANAPEYVMEDKNAAGAYEDGDRGRAWLCLVSGFDESLWHAEMARLMISRDKSQALGLFARLRLVRMGGPEGMMLISSPTKPLRLSMPPVERSPKVAVWAEAGKFVAVLWWPSVAGACAELDKNLDMSTTVHQVRMRRPLYEDDAGWVQSQVKKTLPPVLLPRDDLDGQTCMHAFDVCSLLDDSYFPQELATGALPQQPTGAMRSEVLTYEFSVRVSDGCHWSDWSTPSEPVNFAMEPKITAESSIDVEDLHALLGPHEDTDMVCPVQNVDRAIQPLASQLSYSPEGDMEPPKWVSVSRPLPRAPEEDVAASAAQMSQFVVSWPSLAPRAYSYPASETLPAMMQLVETDNVPEYLPPYLAYRLNVWLVGVSPDAADAGGTEPAAAAAPSFGTEDGVPQEASTANLDVLYRQIDLPVSSPQIDEDADTDVNPGTTISWVLPALLPDKKFRCTVEARFHTLTSVEWWTPLMRSGEFVVERVPPPAPPEPLPICELPTPEYQKLLARTAPGSQALVAVRWPWLAAGRAVDILRDSSHVLEFCRSTERPSLRDPTAKPLVVAGETPLSGRPTGPWKEAKAQQLAFANFEKGQVCFELSEHTQFEINWVPVLVASGLWLPGEHASTDAEEPTFVHLRWRLRAGLSDLAATATPLHFSAGSVVVHTRVAAPVEPPGWRLAVPHRSTKLAAWLTWVAWSGTSRHQFSFRILHKAKRKRKKTIGASGARPSISIAEDSDSSTDRGENDSTLLLDSEASPALEPVTGWVEMPWITDDIQRRIVESSESDQLNDDSVELSVLGEKSGEDIVTAGIMDQRTPEEQLLAQFQRKIPPTDWNRLLWRHYRNIEEHYNPNERDIISKEESIATGVTGATGATGKSQSQSVQDRRDNASVASGRSRSSLGSKGSSKRTTNRSSRQENLPFRMGPNSLLEWRFRVSDGFRWSDWSPASSPAGIVPPVPGLPEPVHMLFNRREPTIARLAWSACKLEPEFEHLANSIEYLVYLTSEEEMAQKFMQEESKFEERFLHRMGVRMSDTSCGLMMEYTSEENTHFVGPTDFESLFPESAARRLIGKFAHRDQKLVTITEDDRTWQISGFELTASGLKPQCLHRISVRVRCVCAGLDEPEWQRMKIDTGHPLRWSDAFNSAPLLTPRMPPPLLVPEAVRIPDGRFGRFTHTPCILLKCPMFAKLNKDDSDKDHKVVVDIRPNGSKDEDYRMIPLENSVYCELAEYGPCRLVFNLPFLHAEMRSRNTTMNDVSAAGIPLFAIPPMVLEDKTGPVRELHVGEDGALYVRLEWTARVLPKQKPVAVQIAYKRHAIDQACTELPACAISADMRLDEAPTSTFALAGEAFTELVSEAEEQAKAKGKFIEGEAALYCRSCFQPLARNASSSIEDLGPVAKGRLTSSSERVSQTLRSSVVFPEQVPAYRGVVDDELSKLRVPHVAEVDTAKRHASEAWERRARPSCGCRDVFCRKDLAVDGEQLRHGTVYTFRVRVDDGLSWSPWSEFSPPLPVMVAPPKVPLPVQENLVPTPPPTMEVMLMKDAPASAAAALAASGASDLRLRLRWPCFEGRMQEVEYRVLMWSLTPEQRKRATGSTRASRTDGLPPIVGTQSFVTSCVIREQTVQVDDSGAPPHIVRPGDAEGGKLAGTAKPRTLGAAADNPDAPQIVAHIRPFDPPARGAGRGNAAGGGLKHTPKSALDGGTVVAASKTVDLEVSVMAVPKGHGYVFAVEAKHSKGAIGNLGEWSIPVFSKCIEFDNQPRQLSVEVDARFGTLLFKGQAATNPKPTNEKLLLEAQAVNFVDEHRDIPKATPILTQPGGDPWPLGGSPKRFVMRTRGKNVYAEHLADESAEVDPAAVMSAVPNEHLEDAPPDDERRVG